MPVPSSSRAPLVVPVELRLPGRGRWFRLTSACAEDRLALAQIVPDEVDGPVELAFHLPGDTVPIRCRGRVGEIIVGDGHDEHAERRILHLLDLQPAERTRIGNYITERLGLNA